MRVALIGAVDSTAAALRALTEAGAPPALLVTLPAAQASRHSDYADLRPAARAAGIEVLEDGTANSAAAVERLRGAALDYVFVIGWSRIVTPDVIASARGGAIGFHPAALPENRGRAVIPWTILQRAASTGTTLFWIDEGLDSGDILAQRRFAVAPDETATTLYEKHLAALRDMIAETVPLLRAGSAPRTPQDHARATWCARRTPDDGLIDWSSSAEDIWTLIRATTRPYPGAFTVAGGERITVWAAEPVGAAPYTGLAGQIQESGADGAIVMCGDGRCIRLTDVTGRSGEPARLVKHARLGIDAALAIERMLGGKQP